MKYSLSPRDILRAKAEVFNRPGVARAVLQSDSSFIDSMSKSDFSS